jgi:hypothetical protein
MQPKVLIWLTTPYGRCDFPGLMTKNCSCSIVAYFHDGAGRLLLSLLPSKGAKNSFLTDYYLSEVSFPGHMKKNCWPAVDSHFHKGVGRVLLSVLPTQAAKNSVVTDYNIWEVWFPRTYDKKKVDTLLTLILPWLYPHYAFNLFGTVHHSHCSSCRSSVIIYCLLDP